MTVYVDSAQNRLGRMIMCHMIADTPAELFAMAKAVGLRREWFQLTSFPHFDLAKGRRQKAVELGAIELDRHAFVARMKAIRERPDWPRAWIDAAP